MTPCRAPGATLKSRRQIVFRTVEAFGDESSLKIALNSVDSKFVLNLQYSKTRRGERCQSPPEAVLQCHLSVGQEGGKQGHHRRSRDPLLSKQVDWGLPGPTAVEAKAKGEWLPVSTIQDL